MSSQLRLPYPAADAQTNFSVSGAGIVAVLIAGIRSRHPCQSILVPGYDFTRNIAGSASELRGRKPIPHQQRAPHQQW